MISPITQRLGAAVVDAHGNLYDHDGNPGQLQVGQHGPAGSTNWHPAARHAPELPKIYRQPQIRTLSWKVICPSTITQWGILDESDLNYDPYRNLPPEISEEKSWSLAFNPFVTHPPQDADGVTIYYPQWCIWTPANDRGLAIDDTLMVSVAEMQAVFAKKDAATGGENYRHDPRYFTTRPTVPHPEPYALVMPTSDLAFGRFAFTDIDDVYGNNAPSPDFFYANTAPGIRLQRDYFGHPECEPDFALNGNEATGKAYYFLGTEETQFTLHPLFILRHSGQRGCGITEITTTVEYELAHTPPVTEPYAEFVAGTDPVWPNFYYRGGKWIGHYNEEIPPTYDKLPFLNLSPPDDVSTEYPYTFTVTTLKEGNPAAVIGLRLTLAMADQTLALEVSCTGGYAFTGAFQWDEDHETGVLTGTYPIIRKHFWVIDAANSTVAGNTHSVTLRAAYIDLIAWTMPDIGLELS